MPSLAMSVAISSRTGALSRPKSSTDLLKRRSSLSRAVDRRGDLSRLQLQVALPDALGGT